MIAVGGENMVIFIFEDLLIWRLFNTQKIVEMDVKSYRDFCIVIPVSPYTFYVYEIPLQLWTQDISCIEGHTRASLSMTILHACKLERSI